MGAVDVPPSLTRLLSEIYCLASCVGYTDGPAVFIAAGDFPIGAETPLLTWVSVATGYTARYSSYMVHADATRSGATACVGLHS